MSEAVLYLNTVGNVGGAEQSLLLLVAHLPLARYRSILLCPTASHLAHRAQSQNIVTLEAPFVPYRLLRRPRAYFAGLLHIIRAIRKIRPVLVHGNGLRSLHYAVPVGKLLRLPTVVHVRDIFIPPSTLTRWLLKNADAQIAISSAVYSALAQQRVLARRCQIIHNGVDVEVFQQSQGMRSKTRAALGIGATDVAVGLVGRLTPWKGHDYFVAAATLLGHLSQLQWFLVGEDWLEDQPGVPADQSYQAHLATQIAQSGVADRIHMLGFRDDIPALMAAFDMVVVPSVEPEPFGRVAIEAMAAAKPVIGTTGGGLTEIIVDGQSGYQIPPRDAQAIADRVAYLTHNAALRTQMGQTGQEIVRQRFSHRAHVAQVTQLYDSMLVESGYAHHI